MKKLILDYSPYSEYEIYKVKFGPKLKKLILYAENHELTDYLKYGSKKNCKYFEFLINLSLFNLDTFDLSTFIDHVFKNGNEYTKIEVARL